MYYFDQIQDATKHREKVQDRQADIWSPKPKRCVSVSGVKLPGGGPATNGINPSSFSYGQASFYHDLCLKDKVMVLVSLL